LTLTPTPNASGVATITVVVTDSSGGSASDTFILTVNAVNDPPSISALGPITLRANSSTNLTFTVADIDSPVSSLVVTSTSLNTVLIPNSGLVVGGSGATRTLMITPAPNQYGASTIRISVRDAGGASVTNTFLVTVVDVNFPPAISDILDRSGAEDAPVTIPFTVSDSETAAGNLAVTAASSNPALIPNSAIVFGGSGANRTITLTPLRNQTGAASITVTVIDANGSEASDGFLLTITNLNDLPTISGLPSITINEDTATGPLSFTVGDVETASGSLSVTATSSNAGLVPSGNIVPGGSGADRTITITPLPDQFGTTTITLTVNDGNGGATNTSFLLTVAAVNDAPTLAPITDRTVTEDMPAQAVPLTGISAGPGEAQSLQITATSGNPALIPAPTVLYTDGSSTGTLIFTPAPNATGSALITVTVNDGAATASNIVRTFTITVTPANDPPVIQAIAPLTMLEDSVLTVPVSISDPDTAAASLTLVATSTNTTLLPASNIFFSGSGTNRTVTFVPRPDLFGTSFVSIAVSDGVASNSTTFQLSVVAVNDAPTLNVLTNVSASAATSATLTFPLQGITAGASNENEIITFSTTNSALPAFWTTPPSVTYISGSTTGLLTFRSAVNQTGSVTIAVIANDGRASNNITARTFVFDARPSANTLPVISTIAGQIINEDAVVGPLAFTVRDTETAASNLVLTAVSTNEALIPRANIIFGGSGSNRTVTLTPVPNASGVTLISVTLRDASAGAVNMNFVVTVNALNDTPVISGISNLSTPENTSPPPILFNVTDVETSPGNLSISIVSGNTSLVPLSNIVLGGAGTNRALLITPATNQSGFAIITVTVSDGVASANTSFTLTVNAVNDPPAISDIPDQITAEATATTAIGFTVSDPDTALTSLGLSAASSNPALIPSGNIVFGGSGGARNVTLTPLPNQSGTAIITVSVNDGTSTISDSFLLTVKPFNRPPTLNPISGFNLNQNAGLQTVALANITSGSVNETQALIVAASSSNPALVPHPSVNYTSPAATGSLTFTPAPNLSGTATITVTVNDGQPQSNIVTRTFIVTINSAPVLAIVPNQIVFEDSVAGVIPFTVGDLETPASSLAAAAVSANTVLLPNSSISITGTGSNRTVFVTPAANLSGNTLISITASDPNGNSSVSTFLLTVVPVNDAPTLNPLPPLMLPANSPLQTVNLTGISSGAPNEAQVLSVTAASSDPSIIPTPAINYTSPNAAGTLTFTPVAGATGVVDITVQAMDDGGVSNGGSNTITRIFRVTVVSAVAPQLRIELTGRSPVVSWPSSAGPGWLLQGAAGVTGVPVWRAVPFTPILTAGRYWVTNSPASTMRYFRLCSGCPPLYSPPNLSIRHLMANDFRISWSAAFGDFGLDSRTNAISGPWTPINSIPVVISGTNNVFVTLTNPATYFRLRGL
jgi:hypothetical protein